jgi:hypothetical protein
MKIRTLVENDDGWTDWVHVGIDNNHRIVCCDCGLSHDFEFGVYFITGDEKQRKKLVKALEAIQPDTFVKFRASRNNRSTGQVRRHKKDGTIQTK